MKIEKGKQYECVKDVVMNGSGKHEFIKGRIYKSEIDNRLINESGEPDHSFPEEVVKDYFKEAVIYTCLTVKNSPLNHIATIEELNREYNLSFCVSSAIHQILKPIKGSKRDDLKKAIKFLEHEIKVMDKKKINSINK